ncbi:hypothetical protein [Glycomyces sp. NRRL B-16210]|uniref:hypothetical protein n=1 Tax=Glycomyces sp. NRRL B-16210 TaxID=1463821 RepID=UPI00068A3439|nr:hypothetical protein [Glycomyces sp. NRRL B-16210]
MALAHGFGAGAEHAAGVVGAHVDPRVRGPEPVGEPFGLVQPGEVGGDGACLGDTLAARPPDEAAWPATRHALDPLIEQYNAHDERTRRLTWLIVNTPTLAAQHREKNSR